MLRPVARGLALADEAASSAPTPHVLSRLRSCQADYTDMIFRCAGTIISMRGRWPSRCAHAAYGMMYQYHYALRPGIQKAVAASRRRVARC